MPSDHSCPQQHQTLLEMKNICMTYPQNANNEIKDVLDNITLSVDVASVLSIVGPSGCGKTTLLRILAGLQQPDSGDAISNNEQILSFGFVFQDSRLLPWRSAVGNVRLPLELIGKRETSRRRKWNAQAMRLLSGVGLEQQKTHFPDQLSGGEQQRVAIARAFVTNPQIVLMDEPFASLDYHRKAEVQELVLELNQSKQSSIVLVTHDIEDAVFMGDRVIVLSPRPAHIVASIDIELEHPRREALKTDHKYFDYTRQVREAVLSDT